MHLDSVKTENTTIIQKKKQPAMEVPMYMAIKQIFYN